MLGWLLLPMVAGAGAVWRLLATRRIERNYDMRNVRTADGTVAGAEPFLLAGTNGRALLLLHGSGDSPQTLRHLGKRLNAAGYTVLAPLLPGHGRSPRDFARVSASAYTAAARAALDELRGRHEWIGVGGLSMGGALAAQLAVDAADVRVLLLLAPYFAATPQVAWATRTAPLWGLVQPYLSARGERSVHDPEARTASYAYGVVAPNALHALLETARRGRAALAGIDAGLASADATEAALRSWSAGLRDDARWTDAKHAGAAAFADHSMRTVLADKRRSAARFLRGLRSEFSTRPGADLLRAAESYGYVVDLAARQGVGAFDASVAMRFADAGHRRGWANALEAAIGHEREAITALRAAREALG